VHYIDSSKERAFQVNIILCR